MELDHDRTGVIAPKDAVPPLRLLPREGAFCSWTNPETWTCASCMVEASLWMPNPHPRSVPGSRLKGIHRHNVEPG